MTTAPSLNDLCVLIVDCEHKTAPLSDEGYPSIRTPNVGRGRLILDYVNRVDQATYERWSRRAVPQANDLIIAREAPLGNVAIIRPGQQVCLGQRTVLVRPDPTKVEPAYLCYFLLGEYAQSRFHSAATGATVPHLNMRDIRNLPVPALPPLSDQRRIASILGAYDDLIEVNRRRIALLEEMARRLFEEWFVHFRFPGHESNAVTETPNGSLPAGWKHGVLGDVVELRRDKASPGEHLSSRAYIPIDCIGHKTLAIVERRPWQEAQSSLTLFERGDILFGAMRPYFHKVAPAPVEGVTRSTCFVLRPLDPELFPFATMALFRDETVAYATAHSKGSTIPYAQWGGSLERFPVAIPDKKLLRKFGEFGNPTLSLIMNLCEANRRLAVSRDLLLPRLISGELPTTTAERELEAVA